MTPPIGQPHLAQSSYPLSPAAALPHLLQLLCAVVVSVSEFCRLTVVVVAVAVVGEGVSSQVSPPSPAPTPTPLHTHGAMSVCTRTHSLTPISDSLTHCTPLPFAQNLGKQSTASPSSCWLTLKMIDCSLDVHIVKRFSRSRCTHGYSYGCINGSTIWVARGCRALFLCRGGNEFECGLGFSFRDNVTCPCHSARPLSPLPPPLPALLPPKAEEQRMGPCNCETASPKMSGMKYHQCLHPRVDDTSACVQDAERLGSALPICCAVDRRNGSCGLWQERCAWHGQDRIAWSHVPKTGSSFLLLVALLANNKSLASEHSLANDPRGLTTAVKCLTTISKRRVALGHFFDSFKYSKWFPGSFLLWPGGLDHSAITQGVYDECACAGFTLAPSC